jgi:hypothetical protein
VPQPSLNGHRNGTPGRVLLVGVARSGTSWLGHALGRARGVRFYYEPDNVDADPTGVRRAGGLGFGPYPMIQPGEENTPFASLWDMVFAGRMPPVDRRPMLLAARVALRVPRSIRDPLVRGVATMAAKMPSRSDFTVVKSIYAVFSLDWLVERYNPQVIAIQRHPLNVVSSWRQLHIPLFDLAARPAIIDRYLEPLGIEPPRVDASELSRIAWQVGLLTHVLGDAVDGHPEWRMVTHEDLCREPVTGMRDTFDSLGLAWTDDVERFLNESNRPGEGLEPTRVTTEQPHRWRKRLTDAEVEEIEGVLDRFPRRGWVRVPTASGP